MADDDGIGGSFDSINDIIAAVNDCSALLELNLASMGAAGTKLDEMQALFGKIAQLRRDVEHMVRNRLEDAAKVRSAMRMINGDGAEPDGDLGTVASVMALIEQGGLTLNDLLARFGQATELVRTLLSQIDTRVSEMAGNQAAAKEILDNWNIV